MPAVLGADDVKGVILSASELAESRRPPTTSSHEPRSFVPQDDMMDWRRSRAFGASSRRLRLMGFGATLLVTLTGCAFSPEAARVRGEPGADVGNHGNPVVLLEPPNRGKRIYAGVPYDEPPETVPDTSES